MRAKNCSPPKAKNMSKILFPKIISMGLLLGSFFRTGAQDPATMGDGPVRVRWSPEMAVQKGLEFRDPAGGGLLRFVDFAKDHPFAHLEFPVRPAVSPYCAEWDLSRAADRQVCRSLDLDPKAYEELYGTTKTCFRGARLQALPEINGDFVAVCYRLTVFGGEGELWRPVCPHFLGVKSHVRVYNRTGNLVFEKSTGWTPLTGAQVSEDGRYLVLCHNEIPGDVPLFQHRFTEGSVWDLRSGQPLDGRFFRDDTRGNKWLKIMGKWVVAQIDYWSDDTKELYRKSVFYDFDSKVKYEKEAPLSQYDYSREDSDGFIWEDPKTKRVVRRVLIELDLKKSPLP
jgi:hypothetical protein